MACKSDDSLSKKFNKTMQIFAFIFLRLLIEGIGFNVNAIDISQCHRCKVSVAVSRLAYRTVYSEG